MSDSLQPHGLQHSNPPFRLWSPKIHPSSSPLNWWCHRTISSSVAPFPSCPQSFPAWHFPPVSQLFTLYWIFSFSISPSNEYSGLISFRIDWFDLLSVQETLKSLLQHHSLKASYLWHSAFFMVQLLQLYMTTWKTITLTIWTFVSKGIFLLLICCLGLSKLFFQGASVF